jgi:hypothetical protein
MPHRLSPAKWLLPMAASPLARRFYLRTLPKFALVIFAHAA